MAPTKNRLLAQEMMESARARLANANSELVDALKLFAADGDVYTTKALTIFCKGVDSAVSGIEALQALHETEDKLD